MTKFQKIGFGFRSEKNRWVPLYPDRCLGSFKNEKMRKLPLIAENSLLNNSSKTGWKIKRFWIQWIWFFPIYSFTVFYLKTLTVAGIGNHFLKYAIFSRTAARALTHAFEGILWIFHWCFRTWKAFCGFFTHAFELRRHFVDFSLMLSNFEGILWIFHWCFRRHFVDFSLMLSKAFCGFFH